VVLKFCKEVQFEGKTRRDIIRNEIFREEIVIEHVLIKLEKNYYSDLAV
jgi:hypothetical protein